MTVKQLIEALEDLNSADEVVVPGFDHSYRRIRRADEGFAEVAAGGLYETDCSFGGVRQGVVVLT